MDNIENNTPEIELKNGICESNPRTVIRGLLSQPQVEGTILNEVGIHWLRCSFEKFAFETILILLDEYFGKRLEMKRGFWGYQASYHWELGAQVHFDTDEAYSIETHEGRFTVELTGSTLDTLTCKNLLDIVQVFRQLDPKCGRIDTYFDDYCKIVRPDEISQAAKKHHYTGFKKKWGLKQEYEETTLTHDEVFFGVRGEKGSGKYLRIYDKNLESKGEKDCVRYEVEWTKKRANSVFIRLSECQTVDRFAMVCAMVTGGSIKFIHRSGKKNISRDPVYDWWKEIMDTIGHVKVRVEKKLPQRITDKIHFVYKNASTSLACVKSICKDPMEFMHWCNDIADVGGEKITRKLQKIIDDAGKENRSVKDLWLRIDTNV